MIKLDHIDNLEITEADAKNLHALDYMRTGLVDLYNSTSHFESLAIKEYGNSCFHLLGGAVGDYGDHVINYVNWFSVSLIAYARLVYVSSTGVQDRTVKEYSDLLFPEVATWRDKIGAHFSFTDPKRDSLALSEFSTVQLLAFDHGRFRAGGCINITHKGSSHSFPNWSLTEVFENDVLPRYFEPSP